MPFTDRQVAALRPKRVRYDIPEPGRTGLALRVSPHGVKSWAFRYRYHGAQKRMLFGTYPELGVVDVRLELAKAQQHLREGRDPGVLVSEATLLEM